MKNTLEEIAQMIVKLEATKINIVRFSAFGDDNLANLQAVIGKLKNLDLENPYDEDDAKDSYFGHEAAEDWLGGYITDEELSEYPVSK